SEKNWNRTPGSNSGLAGSAGYSPRKPFQPRGCCERQSRLDWQGENAMNRREIPNRKEVNRPHAGRDQHSVSLATKVPDRARRLYRRTCPPKESVVLSKGAGIPRTCRGRPSRSQTLPGSEKAESRFEKRAET